MKRARSSKEIIKLEDSMIEAISQADLKEFRSKVVCIFLFCSY